MATRVMSQQTVTYVTSTIRIFELKAELLAQAGKERFVEEEDESLTGR